MQKIVNKHNDLVSDVKKFLTRWNNKEKICSSVYKIAVIFTVRNEAKIHQVLVFKQSQRIEPYIDFKCEKRKKDFYKLLNNSVSGRIMENLKNKVNVRFVTNAIYYKKISK